MDKGTDSTLIIELSTSIVGVSTLSIPYVYALNGWLVGIILNLIGVFSTVWSNKLISTRAIENNATSYH